VRVVSALDLARRAWIWKKKKVLFLTMGPPMPPPKMF
jgi:hypothetical protein